MEFLLIIGQNTLTVYNQQRGMRRQYLSGEPCMYYEIGKVKEYVNKLIETVAKENNLGSTEEVVFTAIGSSRLETIPVVWRALSGHLKEKFDALELLKEAYINLAEKESLFINEYGLNWDGINYHWEEDGEWQNGPFKLLAYTTENEELIKFIDKRI